MIICLIGFFSGTLQALLGIGGGAVIVPALVLLAGFKQKEAQATSLWYVIPTSLLAGVLYASDTRIDIEAGYLVAMVAAAFVGVLVGMPLVRKIHQRLLRQIFGAALVIIAGILIWRTLWNGLAGIQNGPNVRYLAVTWIGLLAGFLSSLLGIGGGVVVVPALVLIGGFLQKTAQGMSLLYVVPTALFGAVMYRFHAKITVEAGKVALMTGSGLGGACIGYLLMTGTRDATLRVIFAAALGVLGILMILRARRARGKAPASDWVI